MPFEGRSRDTFVLDEVDWVSARPLPIPAQPALLQHGCVFPSCPVAHTSQYCWICGYGAHQQCVKDKLPTQAIAAAFLVNYHTGEFTCPVCAWVDEEPADVDPVANLPQPPLHQDPEPIPQGDPIQDQPQPQLAQLIAQLIAQQQDQPPPQLPVPQEQQQPGHVAQHPQPPVLPAQHPVHQNQQQPGHVAQHPQPPVLPAQLPGQPNQQPPPQMAQLPAQGLAQAIAQLLGPHAAPPPGPQQQQQQQQPAQLIAQLLALPAQQPPPAQQAQPPAPGAAQQQGVPQQAQAVPQLDALAPILQQLLAPQLALQNVIRDVAQLRSQAGMALPHNFNPFCAIDWRPFLHNPQKIDVLRWKLKEEGGAPAVALRSLPAAASAEDCALAQAHDRVHATLSGMRREDPPANDDRLSDLHQLLTWAYRCLLVKKYDLATGHAYLVLALEKDWQSFSKGHQARYSDQAIRTGKDAALDRKDRFRGSRGSGNKRERDTDREQGKGGKQGTKPATQ